MTTYSIGLRRVTIEDAVVTVNADSRAIAELMVYEYPSIAGEAEWNNVTIEASPDDVTIEFIEEMWDE